MMTSLHDVTAGEWRRRAMTYSTLCRRGGANRRLRAADVVAMRVGINVQRCAVAARERAATQSDVADDVSSDVVRWRSRHGAGRQRRRRVALPPSARAAARGGAATARTSGDAE